MMQPLAVLGACVVIGAWSWPWMQPEISALLGGLVCLALLCLLAPSMRTGACAWAAGGILLGLLSVTVQPGPIPLSMQAYLQGEVVAVQGPWVRIHTVHGGATLYLGPKPPAPGTRLALWTRSASPRAILPGARDRSTDDLRRKTTPLRPRAWLTLGSPMTTREGPWKRARHGGILRALATGDRAEIPARVTDLMKQTGTVHLLAISGLHVGLVSLSVAGLVGLLTRPLVLLGWAWTPRWLAMGAATAAAYSYGEAVGWPASAQRAGWMAVVALSARAIGRPVLAWNLLGAAAAAVVLTDPGQVGEVGFQLSFGAVAGILLWAPRVQALGGPCPGFTRRWLLSGIGATIGACIGTLPILAWDFQHLAPIGVLGNLVATPLIGTVSVPAALVAAHGPGSLTGLALSIGDGAVGLALSLLRPLSIPPATPATGPLATVGLLVAVLLVRRPRFAAALMLACLNPPSVPEQLSITFPAVGQGSAALIEWPSGRRWLVDGGPPSERLLHWLRREGIRRLDKVVLSHPHPDHMGGLGPVIRSLDVGELWAPDPPSKRNGAFFKLWRAAALRGIHLRVAGDVGLPLLHPARDWRPTSRRPVNDRSLVLRVVHGRHSFLFTGDIEAEGEAVVASRVPRTTVVHVPHHGSRSSSGPALVQATQARWAVVSAGKQNVFGHPAPEVLARWGPARTLRTDVDGSLRFHSDGQLLQVERWSPRIGWRTVDRQPLRPPSEHH